MTKKRISIALVALALIIGIYAVSPYFVLWRIQRAAKANDSNYISEHVDFPALREQLRVQLTVAMTSRMDRELAGNPFAGLGQMFALSMINTMVDTMVTPSGLAAMVKNASPSVSTARNGATGVPETQTGINGDEPKLSIKYADLDEVRVSPESAEGAFIFRRDGWFHWKLVGIDIARSGPR
ncbi:DUF2939 domain-containing protein [Xylophilus rhododendri]|uniref:DUF2939 domain-containing protein n=1 Tax=Xylophilus rhododendri TaxID=2697032 RepID=A0A857JBJ8_9BURK|nr:DUF2939 domain-containing protein [Xylophilus rhododendri]QHJ00086.1 DUF2939 domain-containing protein [Xylophilus rhododendri]